MVKNRSSRLSTPVKVAKKREEQGTAGTQRGEMSARFIAEHFKPMECYQLGAINSIFYGGVYLMQMKARYMTYCSLPATLLVSVAVASSPNVQPDTANVTGQDKYALQSVNAKTARIPI